MAHRRRTPKVAEIGPQNALTCIPRRIHYAATDDEGAEVEQAIIDSFLNTLAEVSLAAAHRKLYQGEGE